MYTAVTFRTTVVDPVLNSLGLYSRAASDLLLGTAVQESGGFRWNRQMGNGPARGYFQMEGATHDDIWSNYLKYRVHLGQLVRSTLSVGQAANVETCVTNDKYAAAMARIQYKRAPEALPKAGDVPALAAYWKKYYNTPLGAGSPDEFIANWSLYIK